MKQVITIGIGQCGIRLLQNLYTCFFSQHLIDHSGNIISESQDYKSSYFDCDKQIYKPRCILVDSEPGLIEQAFSRSWGHLLQPQNCPYSNQSTGNNYAKGFHSVYDQLKLSLQDSIRRTIERCDSPETIEMCFSVGGGTGSGISSALFQYIQDQYPELIKINNIVAPSGKVSDIVVEPYNAVLSLINYQGGKTGNILFSNEATYLRMKNKGYQTITYKNLNEYIIGAMSDTTLGNRTNIKQFNYKKLLMDACPYPRTNFLGVSLASPQQNNDNIKNYHQIFQSKYILSGVSNVNGNYFSIHPIIRGKVPDISSEIQIKRRFRGINSLRVCDWIQPVVPTHYSLTRNRDNNLTLSCIFNSVILKDPLTKIVEDAQKLRIKMCFFHRFQQQGVSQEQLYQSINQVYSIIQDYQDMGSSYTDYGQQSCNSSYCEE